MRQNLSYDSQCHDKNSKSGTFRVQVTRVVFVVHSFGKMLRTKLKYIGESFLTKIIPSLFFCTFYALSPTSKHTPLTRTSFLYPVMYARYELLMGFAASPSAHMQL